MYRGKHYAYALKCNNSIVSLHNCRLCLFYRCLQLVRSGMEDFLLSMIARA